MVSPYNNRFNLPKRGRHAFCSVGQYKLSFGKSRAGTPIRSSFPGRADRGHSFAG